VTTQLLQEPLSEGSEYNLAVRSDRRADIDYKHGLLGQLIRSVGCDGLLLSLPEHFTWLTAGGTPRGLYDGQTAPLLFCTPEARWLIASNVDSPRLFDEEIEALGFQLKEWPWHWGREQFLADLCANRKVAVDAPLPLEGEFTPVRLQMLALRRRLTIYEHAALTAVGAIVAHAVEATCRTIERGLSEREIAGQVAHRLMHRGVFATHVGIAVDGRSRVYRRYGFTAAPMERYAVVSATGRKYGLHATAARMVCFGTPPEELKAELNAVCRVSASYLAGTKPDRSPRELLQNGQRIYALSGYEHEWMLAAQGHLTGHLPVEQVFRPDTPSALLAGSAVVWQASAGAALSADTFLVSERGAIPITPTENWPHKRIRIQGTEIVRPDLLVRG
jgi:Xaa-Pro aminopeptidase